MRLFTLTAFIAVSLAAGVVRADGFALDRFQPAPTTEDGLALALPRTLGHLRPGFVVTLDYAHKPLVVTQNGAEQSLIAHRLLSHFSAALGLGPRVELFVRAPVLLLQRPGDEDALVANELDEQAAFGALNAGMSLRLAGDDDGPLQLGIAGWVAAPTGRPESLAGDEAVGAGGLLTAAAHTHVISFALNVGGRYRPEFDYGDARIGSELLLGGGAYVYAGRRVTFLGELSGAVSLRDWGDVNTESVPLEVLLGMRISTPVQLVFTLGGAYGLTQAIGEPAARAIFQIGVLSPRTALIAPDTDGDGLRDPRDQCVTRREDVDGFEDGDGCPELDNDKDGHEDKTDQCPRDPEDRDGVDDADGCPDLDNDKDGLPDTGDRCPNAVEDRDNYEDEDGCPDLDNDKDTLLDLRDQCTNDAEDFDGFADEDGCPDKDNDKDGTLDIDDQCPTAPGPVDAKGCPTKVRVENNQIRILERIEFQSGRADIRPESFGILDQVRSVLDVNPQIRSIRIEGHTDDKGPTLKNRKLSQRRAEAVMKYLIRMGVAPSRLVAQGWGEERPLVKNVTESDRQSNRRVEFHIVDPPPSQ